MTTVLFDRFRSPVISKRSLTPPPMVVAPPRSKTKRAVAPMVGVSANICVPMVPTPAGDTSPSKIALAMSPAVGLRTTYHFVPKR
jgi:hypothetical protein